MDPGGPRRLSKIQLRSATQWGHHRLPGVADMAKKLAVMPARRYAAPIRRVRHRFVHTLAAELTGVRQRR